MTSGKSIERDQYGRQVRRVLLITLLLNILVVAGKLVAGFLAGSLSVISDALHSSADSMNNIVGLFIIRVASTAPDKDHPFGHHKFETLAAFGIAWFLLVAAYQVGHGAVARLLGASPVEVDVTSLTIGVMVGTLAVNAFVYFYESRKGKRLNSHYLLADANHTLSDIYISLSVLLNLVLIRLGIVDLDSYTALVVAAIITYAAYRIFSSTIPILVDRASVSDEYVAEIVRATPGVQSVHAIMSRGVPGKIFISMHLVVTPTSTVEAHAVTERVEHRLEQKLGSCDVTIHIEPEEDDNRAVSA